MSSGSDEKQRDPINTGAQLSGSGNAVAGATSKQGDPQTTSTHIRVQKFDMESVIEEDEEEDNSSQDKNKESQHLSQLGPRVQKAPLDDGAVENSTPQAAMIPSVYGLQDPSCTPGNEVQHPSEQID